MPQFTLEYRTITDKTPKILIITKPDPFYSTIEYKRFVAEETNLPVDQIIVIGVDGLKAVGKAVV